MKSHTIPLALIALAIFTLAIVLLIKPINQALGEAFTGSASYLQIATTTALTANTNATILQARTDGSCKARIVTVPGSMTGGINILFADASVTGDLSSTTLSGTAGHYQAASTTVEYDSGIYGCGRMSARSWTSGTITVSEF